MMLHRTPQARFTISWWFSRYKKTYYSNNNIYMVFIFVHSTMIEILIHWSRLPMPSTTQSQRQVPPSVWWVPATDILGTAKYVTQFLRLRFWCSNVDVCSFSVKFSSKTLKFRPKIVFPTKKTSAFVIFFPKQLMFRDLKFDNGGTWKVCFCDSADGIFLKFWFRKIINLGPWDSLFFI